jgi:hypothetical protein
VSDLLRERLNEIVAHFRENLLYTAPEAWHERVDQLSEELEYVADDFGTDQTEWAVAYGGEDPNECAGTLQYDDEAEARESLQWIRDSMLAKRTVIVGPWEQVAASDDAQIEHIHGDGSGCFPGCPDYGPDHPNYQPAMED